MSGSKTLVNMGAAVLRYVAVALLFAAIMGAAGCATDVNGLDEPPGDETMPPVCDRPPLMSLYLVQCDGIRSVCRDAQGRVAFVDCTIDNGRYEILCVESCQ